MQCKISKEKTIFLGSHLFVGPRVDHLDSHAVATSAPPPSLILKKPIKKAGVCQHILFVASLCCLSSRL